MDVTAGLDAPVPAATLFAAVEDLGRYPEWLDLVPRAQRLDPAPGGARPAWSVDLRGRLGPVARAKRLRMVRTDHEAGSLVRFERVELDGRHHSAWVLTATVEPVASGSRLTMGLHYGGGLFAPVLERILTDEIERSKPRLLTLVGA